MTKPRKASKSATPATAIAMPITMASLWPRMPLSMIARSSSGLTTVISASNTVAIMNRVRYSL